MIENARAVGLRRHLVDVALLVHAIEAHAGDADDEAAVSIEGHAERPSADMRIDFPTDDDRARGSG